MTRRLLPSFIGIITEIAQEYVIFVRRFADLCGTCDQVLVKAEVYKTLKMNIEASRETKGRFLIGNEDEPLTRRAYEWM